MSATPAFLNESRTPLEIGVGTARSVSRVLRASRAQRLALDGVRTDPMRDLLVDSLKQAEGELAAIDDRMAELGTALDSCVVTSAPRDAISSTASKSATASVSTGAPRRNASLAKSMRSRLAFLRHARGRSIRLPAWNREPASSTASTTEESHGDRPALAQRSRHTARTHASRTDDRHRVAELLGVRVSTVREWGRDGTLPRVKLGRHVRFIRAHVEAAILDAEMRPRVDRNLA